MNASPKSVESAMPDAISGNRLAIVVLHYGDVAHTSRCIESLYARNISQAAIIVVDNGTEEPELSALESHYPALRMIRLPGNLGWAGGCNVGVRAALSRGAQAVCLLNNDTVVPEGADVLDQLSKRFMETGPCLLQPRISYMDGERGEQLNPTTRPGVKVIAENFYELNFAYGACLLVHAEIFERVGLFDERFFLQLEETDFYMRAVNGGYKTYCDTSVIIRHIESASFGHYMTPLKCYYITRNTLLLLEKHRIFGTKGIHKIKQLYWMLQNEKNVSDSIQNSRNFITWVVFDKGVAAGFRAGLMAYIFRRFGRAPKSLEEISGKPDFPN